MLYSWWPCAKCKGETWSFYDRYFITDHRARTIHSVPSPLEATCFTCGYTVYATQAGTRPTQGEFRAPEEARAE